MGPDVSGGKRGRAAIIVAPVATLIACIVLFLNLVRPANFLFNRGQHISCVISMPASATAYIPR